MKTIYVTLDNQIDGIQCQCQKIVGEDRADAEAKALAYLRTNVDPAATIIDNKGNAATIIGVESVEENDCWLKVHGNKPTLDDLAWWAKEVLGPEATGEELYVQNPGTHPGGNAWWVSFSVEFVGPVYGFEKGGQ